MDGKMWFGTDKRMQWIPAPLSGADMSPQAADVGGLLLNGGGWQNPAYGSHGQYQFSWSDASAPEAALLMQGYASGVYGRDLIRFTDPLTYRTNVVPPHWSAPAMTVDNEMPHLRSTVLRPTLASYTAYPDAVAMGLPVEAALYDMSGAPVGYPGAANSLLIPVPPGMTLRMGVAMEGGPLVGVYAAPADSATTVSTSGTRISETISNANIVPTTVTAGAYGVRVWIGRTAVGAGATSLTLAAIIARLFPDSDHRVHYPTEQTGPWVLGEGNTGCRIVGRPTLVKYNGVDVGQVGYSLTLREVGAWEF